VEKMTNKLICFLYHEVTDDPKSSGFQRSGAIPYKHSISHFKNDLNLILQQYEKSEDVRNITKGDIPRLILTFDDGGKSAVDVAKILKNKNLIGHFFITTSMIGESTFLDIKQIIEIKQMGHIIGAHSHNHPSIFRDLSYNDKINEWKKSKEILDRILNEEVVVASVPGGDMDQDTIRSAGEVGVKFLFTSEPNYTPYEKFGVLVLGRVCPKNTTNSSQISQWAMGKGFVKAQLIRSIKEFIRCRLKFIYKFYIKINTL
jgi:peptidoglycan/xylan/chitin deacetylase (PgdA/CDA1 family)